MTNQQRIQAFLEAGELIEVHRIGDSGLAQLRVRTKRGEEIVFQAPLWLVEARFGPGLLRVNRKEVK